MKSLDLSQVSELLDINLWENATESRHKAILMVILNILGDKFELNSYKCYLNDRFAIFTIRHKPTQVDFNLLPGGKFMMGLSDNELNKLAGIDKNSDIDLIDYFPQAMCPTFEVQIMPFLVSNKPLLRSLAIQHSVLRDNSGRPDFGNQNNTPVYLDFDEAKNLLKYTGFRLMSESECEYTIRAGTKSLFYFGDSLPENHRLEEICSIRFDYMKNSILSNQFGLYGNAFGTFCMDHWHSNYKGIPKDGSPWLEGGEDNVRVVRGGATSMWPWANAGEWLTLISAMRLRSDYMYECMSGVRPALSICKY